jgi:two-component system phosphate regulon sensor histidine kinase PhoR
MFKTLSNRLIFSYALLIGVLSVSLFVFFNSLVYNTNISIIENEMGEKSRFLEQAFLEQKGTWPGNRAAVAREAATLTKIVELRVTLVNPDGSVFFDSEVGDASAMDNHLNRAEVIAARDDDSGYSIRHSSTIGTDMLYYARKTPGFYIRLAKPLHSVDENLAKTKRAIALFSVSAAIAGLLFVVMISRRLTRPLRETRAFAEEFSQGHYERRIQNYSDDEIGLVQRALNNLADTVKEKMDGLVSEQNKLAVTLETMTDGIALIYSDGTFGFTNSAFSAVFGYAGVTAGRRYFEVIRSRRINARLDKVSGKNMSDRFEEEFSDGRVFEIIINPVSDSSAAVSTLLVMHDITEKKRIDRVKSDLVGNMSHELKTPVTIIKGYLETIQSSIREPEMCMPLISRAIENADRQNAIINDILKLHRIESSGDIERETIDLQAVIDGCIGLLSAKAANRKVILSAEYQTQTKVPGGNRFLAEEIFFNLIDNAIAYNRENGGVTVTVKRKDKNIICSVKDTGSGIPKESIDRIFERFYRVDKSRSRATGGTGLGLSIVKHSVELLGWKIAVVSEGAGSEFIVTI